MTIDALAIQVRLRLSAPARGGTPTDSEWTLRRQAPLSEEFYAWLKARSDDLRKRGVTVTPMQVLVLLAQDSRRRMEAGGEPETTAASKVTISNSGEAA